MFDLRNMAGCLNIRFNTIFSKASQLLLNTIYLVMPNDEDRRVLAANANIVEHHYVSRQLHNLFVVKNIEQLSINITINNKLEKHKI